MRVKQFNEEVFFADEQIVSVGRNYIEHLEQRARLNARKRMRLCTHRDVSDTLHEMLIIHEFDTYVRSHKHLDKSESFCVLEGLVDVVIFNEVGDILEVIRMSDFQSDHTFYYRISVPLYHTLLIRSEILVFHETTNGPFRRSDTVFAPWAPKEENVMACQDFMGQLSRSVDNFLIDTDLDFERFE